MAAGRERATAKESSVDSTDDTGPVNVSLGPWSDYVSPTDTFTRLVDVDLNNGASAQAIREIVNESARRRVVADFDHVPTGEPPSTTVDAMRDKVRERVLEANEGGALLESAYEAQQAFLARRERHDAGGGEWYFPYVRWAGFLMILLAVAVSAAGLAFPLVKAPEAFGWPPYWSTLLPILVLGGLSVIFLWGALGPGDGFLAMFVPAAIAAVLSIVGIVWGVASVVGHHAVGIGIGIFTVFFVVGLYTAGGFLSSRFRRDKGADLQSLYDAWCAQLWSRSVLPALNFAINEVREHRFSTAFRFHGTIGEVRAGAVIDTAAASELRRAIKGRSRGSIALAGPRGAGKSTLLERWTSGAFVTSDAGSGTLRFDLKVNARAPVGYDQKEFLTYLFGRLCSGADEYAKEYRAWFQGTHPELSSRRLLRAISRLQIHDLSRMTITSVVELEHLAAAERGMIRFVQSTTSSNEMSAGIARSGLSVGVKTGEAVRRDTVPLNHPELVDEFRRFLEQAAWVVHTQRLYPTGRHTESRNPRWGDQVGVGHNGSVLVAIDELDRISDGAQAQKFLNELKALFGVPNCFFLVSVSEDALNDFELSAMGMRTAIDSAFDDVVRVGYLDLREAGRLIDRLVIGVPRPFVALVYAFSGGLARQFLRTARQVGQMDHSDEGENTLGSVSAEVVRWQTRNTVRAATDRLFGSVDTGFGECVLRILDEMGAIDDVTSRDLRERESALRSLRPGADDIADVTHLRDEIAAMCNFLATVLDVFTDELDEEDFERRSKPVPDGFDALARVRRHLGANPHRADELLDSFRR